MDILETMLESLQTDDVVPRIWHCDHTVWKQHLYGISDRMSWIDSPIYMREHLPSIREFASEICNGEFKHVVLLGMGGTSIGPEILQRTFCSPPAFPELIVLDSTVPSHVRRVTETVNLERTIFVVSSTSGNTLEPHVLYRYFRGLVEKIKGQKFAGENFVAVTNPDTLLEQLAVREGFRRIFLSPRRVGGRYSVLTFFGLIPSSLFGLDLDRLLGNAEQMREACSAGIPVANNPGAVLGATIGSHALNGRDKLTLIASPSIDSFPSWVEQLIAESTGKEGKGIVPVAEEPLLRSEKYSSDRLFVYIRVDGDVNELIDFQMSSIEDCGHPVIRIDLADRYQVGAEFFKWEIATAVACSILEVNPFDQPDVERSKEQIEANLKGFFEIGQKQLASIYSSLEELLAEANSGDYFAINAFFEPTPEIEMALKELRAAIVDHCHLATTLGYGPRFLHSTGQLHKGGPNKGLFLQLTTDQPDDLQIPGNDYKFGELISAQAVEDLRVLQKRGRRVARIHLGVDLATEIREITEKVRA